MAYATADNWKSRFANDREIDQLFDGRDATTINTLITEAIAEADGTIDSYLGVVYITPIDTTTYPATAALLRGCSLDIASYYVLGGRNDLVSDAKTKLFEHRIEWLKMISERKLGLTGAVALPPTAAASVVADWGSGDADVESDDSVRLLSRVALEAV